MSRDDALEFAADLYYGRHEEDDPEPTFAEVKAEWDSQRMKVAESLDIMDVTDELFEAGDALVKAIKTRDDATVGRLVKALVNGYIDRVTDRAMAMQPAGPFAKDAVAAVLGVPA